MKIIPNPNQQEYEKVTRAVQKNSGYCPCALIKDKTTLCICKEFIESKELGLCHCGRYKKVEL